MDRRTRTTRHRFRRGTVSRQERSFVLERRRYVHTSSWLTGGGLLHRSHLSLSFERHASLSHRPVVDERRLHPAHPPLDRAEDRYRVARSVARWGKLDPYQHI